MFDSTIITANLDKALRFCIIKIDLMKLMKLSVCDFEHKKRKLPEKSLHEVQGRTYDFLEKGGFRKMFDFPSSSKALKRPFRTIFLHRSQIFEKNGRF